MKKIFGSKIFGFIIGFLRTIFVIVIMCYLAFVVVQRVSGNKSVFGYRLFTIATGYWPYNQVIRGKNSNNE